MKLGKLASGFFLAAILLLGACGKTDPKGSNQSGVGLDNGSGNGSGNGGAIASANAITDINVFFNANDRASLVGRQVVLDQLHVKNRVGYLMFFTGWQLDKLLPIAVHEKISGPKDPNRPHVKTGAVVRIEGRVVAFDQANLPPRFLEGLTQDEIDYLRRFQIYVDATVIRSSSWGAAAVGASDLMPGDDLGQSDDASEDRG